MKRIYLTGLAIAASSLAVAIMVAPAGAKTGKSKGKATRISCGVNESIAVPAGSDSITPPVSSGRMYGTADCGSLGSGVQSASVTLQNDGDYTGVWWHYLKTGAIYGTYDLTPQSGQPTNQSTFAAVSYTGTLVVKGGTGTLKAITGTGTVVCNSPDSIHNSCTEKLSLKLPVVTKG